MKKKIIIFGSLLLAITVAIPLLTFLVGWLVFWILFWILVFVYSLPVFVIFLLSCPIKYRVTATTDGEEGNSAHVFASYFMRLVRFRYTWEKGVHKKQAWIAWYELDIGDETDSESDDEDTTSSGINGKLLGVLEKLADKHTAEQTSTEAAADASVAKTINHTTKNAQSHTKPSNAGTCVKETTHAQDLAIDSDDLKEEEPKPGFIASMKAKHAKFKETKAKALDVWNHPDRKQIISLCLTAIWDTIKILMPRHMDVSGDIGFVDPSATGKLFAAYGAACGIFDIAGKIRITPVFDTDKNIYDLNAHIHGCINIMRTLLPALRLAVKKPVRKLLWQLLK